MEKVHASLDNLENTLFYPILMKTLIRYSSDLYRFGILRNFLRFDEFGKSFYRTVIKL